MYIIYIYIYIYILYIIYIYILESARTFPGPGYLVFLAAEGAKNVL